MMMHERRDLQRKKGAIEHGPLQIMPIEDSKRRASAPTATRPRARTGLHPKSRRLAPGNDAPLPPRHRPPFSCGGQKWPKRGGIWAQSLCRFALL
jgi:hypothetical protein